MNITDDRLLSSGFVCRTEKGTIYSHDLANGLHLDVRPSGILKEVTGRTWLLSISNDMLSLAQCYINTTDQFNLLMTVLCINFAI